MRVCGSRRHHVGEPGGTRASWRPKDADGSQPDPIP
jgi:hypothetical protein